MLPGVGSEGTPIRVTRICEMRWLALSSVMLVLPTAVAIQQDGAQSERPLLLFAEPSGSGQPVIVLQTQTHRVMLLGSVVIGAEYLADWARDQAAFSGMALMQTLAFLRARPSRILALGLGSGTAPAFFRQRGIWTDVVEINGAVVAAANRHFLIGEFEQPGNTIIADALEWLQDPGEDYHNSRYDVVLSDMFEGTNPTGSISEEHFRLIKRDWLTSKGVLALNIVAFGAGKHARLAKAVARTLRSLFQHVLVFADHDASKVDADGHQNVYLFEGSTLDNSSDLASTPCNLLFVGSDAPIAFDAPGDEGDPVGSCYHLHAHFLEWQVTALSAASEGIDGEVLRAPAPNMPSPTWLHADSNAITAALPAMQHDTLPASGWRLVDKLLLGDVSRMGSSGRLRLEESNDDDPTKWESSAARHDEI